jgi:hypothetical protein
MIVKPISIATYSVMRCLFIAIDKTTNQIGLFDCSPDFYESGKDKVKRACEAYDLFYQTESFDPKQYFISKTL